MSNLTAMLAFPVHAQITKKYKEAKLDYKINWAQALAKMKVSGMLLFFRKLPIRIIKKLQSLFLENISAVRPGRKYPRKPKLIKKSYAFSYKPISELNDIELPVFRKPIDDFSEKVSDFSLKLLYAASSSMNLSISLSILKYAFSSFDKKTAPKQIP